MKKSLAALAASLIFCGLATAQDWTQVESLYRGGMYSQAIRLLDNEDSPTARGWRALCALSMRTEDAYAIADNFLEFYPENILTAQVCYAYGLALFDNGRYEDALNKFNRISVEDLYEEQRAEYTYKLGYSAYGVGEWERAKGLLARARGFGWNDFSAPSFYILGYINYAQGNFKDASEWFLTASKDHRFEALANYYILECRFNMKDYKWVVEFGEDLFDKVPKDRQPHMARIMSESYLVLGDVEKARSYYEENLKSKIALTRSDYFYAGEVHYLAEDWAGAVENFSKMEERTDSLGQIASYNMGYSYVQLRNKVAAMDAFKEASALKFSPEIQEDAFYNYAKLAFDLGRDTAPFQEYLKRYDARKKGDQIYSYMAMVALQNHDYEAAVEAYDNIEDLDPRMKSNYMKAYLLRARELMDNGSWRAAIPHLKAAAYYSSRREGFNQLARFYEAEALYRDGKYQEARTILNDLYNLSALKGRKEGSLITYNMAYTYFREEDYARAMKWFQSYLEEDSSLQGEDAMIRIADCYFLQGDYVTAAAAYERQMAQYPAAGNLYPAYKAGVASGLTGDNTRKVNFLEIVKNADPKAPYYGESLYELGRAYVALNDNEDAVRAFRTLKASTQDPELEALALLELGMIARNEGKGDDAIAYYKQVVETGGEHAEDALVAIESIYRTREDPEAYLAYINSLGDKAGRTEAQKEEVYFSSAEQVYLSGDYGKASATLQAYLQKYPNAIHGAKAKFYLAECYRFADSKEQAADSYLAALDAGLDGALAESALVRYAALNFDMGNFGKAYGAYLQVKEKARMEENRTIAAIGLMRSAFKARQWDDAIESVGEVLAMKDADASLKREAIYIRANSLMSSSCREAALADFKTLSAEPSTNEGAQACYVLIQDQYDRGSFDGIPDMVFSFAEKAMGQNYWLAKAFITLGDTYAEQGNFSQARATFESIRDGYTPEGPQDDVLDQVQLRLKKLQN